MDKKDNTINIWHIYARYFNFGDHALGVGLRNILLKYFKKNLLFKSIDIHTLDIDEVFISQMNEDADLMLVGGGGLIHGFAGDKWMLHLPDELIQTIKVPIVCYGLGYNQFREESDLSPEILNNLKLLKEKAFAFSVRNDRSQRELKRLGINFEEVPDSGFFVDQNIPPSPVEGKYVTIQLAYDMKENRGIKDEKMIQNFAEITRYLLGKGYKVVFCPHVRKDCEISEAIVKEINQPGQVFMWNWYEMVREANTLNGLAYYKHASFVIGMRGHSQICPIGLGTPVISIVSHRKNIDLLRELGLEKYSIELLDAELVNKIKELIQDVEKNNDMIRQRYEKINQGLEEKAKKYLEGLSKKFSTSNL